MKHKENCQPQAFESMLKKFLKESNAKQKEAMAYDNKNVRKKHKSFSHTERRKDEN